MSSPVRCDTLGEFVDLLRRHEDDILGDELHQGIVLVLRNAERIRELDANLLPGFMRLQELTGVNVCVLLLSRVSFNKFLMPSGLPRPFVVQLKPYTKEELVKIISVRLRESDPKQLQPRFYENYAKLVLGEKRRI